VLQNCDHCATLVLKFEHQVHRRADIHDVVERELLAVKLMRDFVEAAIQSAGLMRIFAVAKRLLAAEREAEGLAELRRLALAGMGAEIV